MKYLSKKNTKIIFSIFIGIVFSIFASYVSALTSRPLNVNIDAPDSIDVGTSPQTKGDPNIPSEGQISLKSFLSGFIPNTDSNCSSDDSIDYSYINENGAMSIGRCSPLSGITLDIKGKTGVKGTIRSTRLAHEEDVNVPICTSISGEISLCSESILYEYEENTDNIYPLVIPQGVSSITVTLYGGGGAGYGDLNKSGYDADGEDSLIRGKDVSLIASGGKSAKGLNTFGEGGEVFTSISNNKASITTSNDGGDGENPPTHSTLNPTIVLSGNCSGTTYYLMQGGLGNIGGKGGAPYGAGKASGGSAGNFAPLSGSGWSFTNGGNINCNLASTTSDDHLQGDAVNNRPGGDGADGAFPSGGGAGFGGKGGFSGLVVSCENHDGNPIKCNGGISGAGGGAGAYIYANINVSGGEIFYIKVGGGGEPKNSSCVGINCNRNQLGGGAVSGNGGDGKVEVSFNYSQ